MFVNIWKKLLRPRQCFFSMFFFPMMGPQFFSRKTYNFGKQFIIKSIISKLFLIYFHLCYHYYRVSQGSLLCIGYHNIGKNVYTIFGIMFIKSFGKFNVPNRSHARIFLLPIKYFDISFFV